MANWATRGLASQIRERMEAKQQQKAKRAEQYTGDYWAFGALFSPLFLANEL